MINNCMKKICGLTTLPITIKSFMLGNLNYMADNGYKAYVISQPGNPSERTPWKSSIYTTPY